MKLDASETKAMIVSKRRVFKNFCGSVFSRLAPELNSYLPIYFVKELEARSKKIVLLITNTIKITLESSNSKNK